MAAVPLMAVLPVVDLSVVVDLGEAILIRPNFSSA